MKWISSPRITQLLFVSLGILLLASCSGEEKNNSALANGRKLAANVIYGADGRLDLYQISDDRLRALADSTVALVQTADLSAAANESFNLHTVNYGSMMNLCSSEKYREQDTLAFCSGSLIAPDIILTAGHCIQTQLQCENTSFVFGFAMKSIGTSPKMISSKEVYRCKEILKTERNGEGADFAIIKLDRTVIGHKPLSLRRDGEARLQDQLVVIGHPAGLPTKIATGGSIRKISTDFFQANLDTFGGNSGSAVINAQTGLVEGVLVRGEMDYERQGTCRILKVCADDACRGEDVTKISVVRAFLPEGANANPQPPGAQPVPELQNEIFLSKVHVPIPDNNKTGISNSITLNSVPNGRKVIIAVNIRHTYIGDLVVKLTAPDGKVITLHERAGGSQRNLIRNFEVTSQLGNQTKIGIYQILVKDLAANDKGVLINWSVRFNN